MDLVNLAGKGSAAYNTGYALGPVVLTAVVLLLIWGVIRLIRGKK